MLDETWFDHSLAGALDEAERLQYRQSRELRIAAATEDHEQAPGQLDSLPHLPYAPSGCPGFDRLDAIMSIPMSEPEVPSLATYKPVWSGTWAEHMSHINEDEL